MKRPKAKVRRHETNPRSHWAGETKPSTTTRTVQSSRRVRVSQFQRGFTLIETALATIIIGVGVLAIVAAQQAFHQANAWSTHAGTATQLGNEIRELTLNLPRHDPVTGNAFWGPEPHKTTIDDLNALDDFDGLTFTAADGTGPINAHRESIPNMNGWAQIIEVNMVDPSDINHTFDKPDIGPTEDFEFPDEYLIRIDVVVTYQGMGDDEPRKITRVSWIAPN